ncbi:MAG: CHAT domain-containing tetratricopeptide repeat protein, partial [Bacteroidota bacterium]
NYADSVPERITPIYNSLGVLSNREKQYRASIKYLQKALRLNIQAKDYAQIASNYNNLGDAYWGLGLFDSSALFFQQAIIADIPTFQNPDILSTPNIHEAVAFDVPRLFNTLSSKGKALLALYKQNKQPDILQAAYHTFVASDQMVQVVRQSYLTQGSKTALVKEAKPMYEQAIETCYQLYQTTQDPGYLHSALHFSESSKAVILLDAIQITQTLQNALPLQTQKQIRDVQGKRLYFEKQLLLDPHRIGVRDSIMKYREKQTALYSTFLPPSGTSPISLTPTQLHLHEWVSSADQALIEYFVGEKHLYIFLVTSQQVTLHKVKREEELTQWVHQFRKEIIMGVTTADLQSSMKKLVEGGYKLYQQLLAPLDPTNLPRSLTIVRDDVLELLPFEALVTQEITLGDTWEEIPYLLKSHIISYAFSANARQVFQKNIVKPQKVALGIAPVDFQNLSSFDLIRLPQTIKEIQQIQRIFGEEVALYQESQGTTINFLQQADEFAIVYLASHGRLNNQDPMLNGIAFFDDMLYTTDVYPLILHAELVVLRACESGAGQLIPGEGIISLSHGFAQTGAKSIFSTQWVVPNATRFMGDFLQQLKEGARKDEALHIAKMGMAHSQHPYYWAAYEIRGDMRQIDTVISSNAFYLNILLCGLAILLIAGAFVYFRPSQRFQSDV